MAPEGAFSMRKRVLLFSIGGICVVLAAYLMIMITRQPQTPILPKPSLKALAARHDMQLGNFAILSRLDERQYSSILSSQFNLALIDNTPNWYFTDGGLRPSPTTYDFGDMDRVVSYGEAHHMALQAHHLVWGEEKWLPAWLKDGHYSKEQLMGILHDHIQTVAGRYSGKIQEWTVVNEAFPRGLRIGGNHDWWADHIGDMEYIDQAFVWARQADPHAVLILNDYMNESINEISDAEYAYVRGAKTRGIPIDGIGMQMHIDGAHPPQKDEVIANMKRFGDLGLAVYVTEFDVNMHDVNAGEPARRQIQATIYYEMMRACIESGVCHSFSFLGITDKETWYNYMNAPDANPLLFDDRYVTKPAFYAVRAALTQN